jgi:thioredoxin 1
MDMTTNVIELTVENIKQWVNSKEVSLVDVWAPWCGPCKQLSPIIDEVSAETFGNYMIGKLNADTNMDFCKEMNIRNIPTILIYKSGEVVEQMSGVKSKNELLELLTKHS